MGADLARSKGKMMFETVLVRAGKLCSLWTSKSNLFFIFICLVLLMKALIYWLPVPNPVLRGAAAETELGMQGLYWEKQVYFLCTGKREKARLDKESFESGMLI